MHRRVVNVRAKGVQFDVYVGRGKCPCSARPCMHHGSRGRFGNRFDIRSYGKRCMALFIDDVAHRLKDPSSSVEKDVHDMVGKVLGCYCAGVHPACHGEVWARLADAAQRGEPLLAALQQIRADILGRLGLGPQAQSGLFAEGGPEHGLSH